MTTPAAPPPGTTDPAAAPDASGGQGGAGDIAVVLMVPDDAAQTLPVDPADQGGPLFLTLAFLAKPDTMDPAQFLIAVLTAVRDAAQAAQPVNGQINGLARISASQGDQDEFAALFESPDIEPLRSAFVDSIESAAADNGNAPVGPDGQPIPDAKGPVIDPGTYLPKIMLGTIGTTADLPSQRIEPTSVAFDTVTLVQDETLIEVPIGAPNSNPDRPDLPNPQDTTPVPSDTTAPSGATKARKPPTVGRGSYVKVGSQQGRVDLVVTSGKVPGVDSDIEGSASNPALRVVVYTEANGKWNATGKRIAARADGVTRIAPLMNRPAKKDSGMAALVDLQTAHEAQAEQAGWPDHARPDGEAIKAVYERGVKSWPGAEATSLDAQEWATGRVKAFLAAAAGNRPEGYSRDDDLLPVGHPESKRQPDEDHETVVLDPGEVKALVDSFRTPV